MKEKAELARRAVFDAVRRLNTFAGDGGRSGRRTPWATAMLAKLRRAAGTKPGEHTDIWEVTLADAGGDLRVEWAIHTALTLFAMHQQGKAESVSEQGVGFGAAARRIVSAERENEAGVRRRFNALATAGSLEEFSYHARSMVQLMKQADVKLDYPQFAADLYWYQFEESKVPMQWGRAFYTREEREKNDDE